MKKRKKKKEIHFSDDAILILSLLPSDLPEYFQKKAFNVLGRTNEELLADKLLYALINIEYDVYVHRHVSPKTNKKVRDVLNQSTT